MMKNDVLRTLVIAAVLCFVCSALVSGATVLLKSRQEVNVDLDIKKNLLLASGLVQNPISEEEITRIYQDIQIEVIDLQSGNPATNIDANAFDFRLAIKDPSLSTSIQAEKDLAGIKVRSKYMPVYKYMPGGVLQMLILPVYGKGLWSTLYGFLALSADTQTVKGLGFYSHRETAGLGGEIDNPNWKAQWIGKSVYDGDLNYKLQVIRGKVLPNHADAKYQVDGLSGATITAQGVSKLLQYWLGEDGFGPFLQNMRQAALVMNRSGFSTGLSADTEPASTSSATPQKSTTTLEKKDDYGSN